MFKRLFSSVREYRGISLLTLLLIVGEVVIECLIPFITADLVNRLQSGLPVQQLLSTGLVLVLMALLSLCFGGLAGFTSARASAGFAKNLRHDMFEKIQSFSFGNVDRFSSSSLVTRLTTDITYVQMAYMMVIRIAVRSPLMLVFSVVMAYLLGGSLSTAFVVVIPVLAFGLITIARFAMPAFRRVFAKYDKLNQSVEENVRAIRVVKGFSREPYEKEKFAAAADSIRRDFTRAERIVAFNQPLMQLCISFNMIFILYVGARIIISTTGTALNVGHITAMLTYGFQVLMSLMMLSMIYVMLTMSLESMRRINEVLAVTPSLTNPENPCTVIPDGSIDFEGVSFRYSDTSRNYALADVDLHIDSGMTVGILGGTGSSKSTLVQLIPRLYDVSKGCVRVGGRDVREYDLTALRDSVAMVLQKNQLFSGTIAENLRWGNPDATLDELREACRLAQADEFIASFPDGYETRISQGGTNVSGGQKQRLCIARALLKHPKILIMDDSTSAVDTRTDALIRQGMRSYLPDTTKLIIAQRVSSVQDADLILVMDNGRITDSGTHEQLLVSCDMYRDIFEQQTHREVKDA